MKNINHLKAFLKKQADIERHKRIALALTQWDRERAVRHLVSDKVFGRLNMGRN